MSVGLLFTMSLKDQADVLPSACATSPDIAQLVRDHSQDVYRIVARLLGPATPQADLEDLTQQVFIAAHDGRNRFRGEAQVTTWLYGIASRTVLRYLRSWRRQRRMLETLEAMVQVAATGPVSPEQQVGDREMLEQVWACLLKIKPKKRIVYILHEVEGLSIKDIAKALDANEATVWSRLHHARKELDRALEAKEVSR